jgi:hypothetical protein
VLGDERKFRKYPSGAEAQGRAFADDVEDRLIRYNGQIAHEMDELMAEIETEHKAQVAVQIKLGKLPAPRPVIDQILAGDLPDLDDAREYWRRDA